MHESTAPEQTASRRSDPRLKHRLTRLGLHFLFVGTFAMLGGSLRGFNLLLVLAGLLVGALIVQWRWSRRSVEAITLSRRLPTEAFAGTSFRVRCRLHNRSRFMPVWMIRVEDTIRSLHRDDEASAICAAGVIAPRQTIVPHYDCVVTHRGRYRFGPLTLATSFPFALFTSRQIVDDAHDFYVYPQLLRLRRGWQRRLLSRTGGITATANRSGPSEGEFYGLREWRSGDALRTIHWRTTARLGEPAVRQFEQQRRFDTCILVDGFDDDAAAAVDITASRIETAISFAATLVIHLVGSPANRVVLAIAATETDAVVAGGSSAGKRRMLGMLAELNPCQSPLLNEAADKAIKIVGQTQDLVIISPRSYEDAARQDNEALNQMIQPWVRRGSYRWIDVGDPSNQRWLIHERVAKQPGKASRTTPIRHDGVVGRDSQFDARQRHA